MRPARNALRYSLPEPDMSTTTIRISDELKARLHALAEQEGTSAHALILEAIADKADQVERRNDSYAQAEQRAVPIGESGETVPWNDMKSWLKQGLAAAQTTRPTARPLSSDQ